MYMYIYVCVPRCGASLQSPKPGVGCDLSDEGQHQQSDGAGGETGGLGGEVRCGSGGGFLFFECLGTRLGFMMGSHKSGSQTLDV